MASVKIRGSDGEIYSGGQKIAARADINITISMGTADASDHDSGGWGETITTIAKATVDATGWLLLDGASKAFDAGQDALIDAAVAGTTLALEFRPGGSGAGKAKLAGNFRITSIKIGSPQNGAAPFDLSFENAGAVTPGAQAGG